MNRLKSILIKCGITAVVGVGMVFLVLNLHGFSALSNQSEQFRLLADAFTIPGVIMIMVGLLIAVANGGIFNGVSYVVGFAVKMLVPGAGKDHERYGDYVERKQAKGKVRGYGFLFLVGIVFVLIAAVFTVMFYVI